MTHRITRTASNRSQTETVLAVSDFSLGLGGVTANVIDGVSFSVESGQTLCIVGESGCGKTLTALSLLGLVSMPPFRIRSGKAVFEDQNLFELNRRDFSSIRGNRISIIFQEPMTSLNPSHRIGDQIAEVVIRHRQVSSATARIRALEMLDLVKIPAAKQRLDDYPHQLSGGMRQRVMIAIALANEPSLLIADEPTTALDVTIQAQIIELIQQLQQETGTALILITHDLGIVANMADQVIVMYAGRVMEQGPVGDLFANPQHPYTIGLMSAIPTFGDRGSRLATIPGVVPTLTSMPDGCRFSPRCPFATNDCPDVVPELEITGAAHSAACINIPLESAIGEVTAHA